MSTNYISAQPGSDTRLRGRWLVAARLAWVTITLLTVGLYIASLPAAYAYNRNICTRTATDQCEDARLTRAEIDSLATLGVSANVYAAYFIALNTVLAAIYLAIAIIIFIRRSDDRLALFAALMLVTFGVATFSSTLQRLAASNPAWWLPAQFLTLLGDISILIFFYVFPSGQFVPWWTRGLAILWIVMETAVYLFPQAPFSPSHWPPSAYYMIFAAFVSTGLFSQVYRYQRVSDQRQRQQTKWVVFGVAVALSGFLGLVLLILVLPTVEQTAFGRLAVGTAFPLCLLFIPLSIGAAILRSRLWDIDIIIRRTLVYSLLTGALAVVYFGAVLLLQALFRAVMGEGQNQFVTVLSTLAMAALFSPLRQRIQNVIDRRFYRRKYNAAKTLAAFSATARDEVDLNTLTGHLVEAVKETMRPESVSLWLKLTVTRGGSRRTSV